MTTLRGFPLAALLAAGLSFSAGAGAALVGDSVTCSYTFAGRACNPTAATVVDPGAEFMLGSQLQVDVSETTIVISQVAGTFGIPSDEMLTIGDMQWSSSQPSTITAVTLGTVTELTLPPEQLDLSFTADSVTIDLSGTSTWRTGSSVEILVSHMLVPVPAAAWLFASALLWLGRLGSRRA